MDKISKPDPFVHTGTDDKVEIRPPIDAEKRKEKVMARPIDAKTTVREKAIRSPIDA